MLYYPSKSSRMWDTWLYYDKGIHYLYHLYLFRTYGDGIILATSEDGVHFTEVGPVVDRKEDACWVGTGSVWPAQGKFIMNFSEIRDGVQGVFFAESEDLIHWKRLPDEYRCDPDPRWYDNTPTGRWDCISALTRPGGGFWGILTARPWTKTQGLSYESIGRVESDDGVHWHAAAPMPIDWGEWPKMNVHEPVGLEKIGDRYYILMGNGISAEHLGDRQLWDQVGSHIGMYTFVADNPEGPCRPDHEAFPLLVSNSWHIPVQRRSMTAWCARFYRVQDALLIHHHTISRSGLVWFAPLKKALVDADGHLSLGYWQGNESLKGKALTLDLSRCTRMHPVWDIPDGRRYPESSATQVRATSQRLEVDDPYCGGVAMLDGRFDLEKGVVLEGEFELHAQEGRWGSIGVYIEESLELSGLSQGTAVLAETRGRTEIGVFRNARSNRFRPDDTVPIGIPSGQRRKLRLHARRSLLEVYLDERLVQCYSTGETTTGRIGLAWESGRAVFQNVRAWEMSL